MHCVKSIQIRSFSGPYFPHLDWVGKITFSAFEPITLAVKKKSGDFQQFSSLNDTYFSESVKKRFL